MTNAPQGDAKSQLDKFKEAARQLETDDLERLKERVGKLVNHKPVPGTDG